MAGSSKVDVYLFQSSFHWVETWRFIYVRVHILLSILFSLSLRRILLHGLVENLLSILFSLSIPNPSMNDVHNRNLFQSSFHWALIMGYLRSNSAFNLSILFSLSLSRNNTDMRIYRIFQSSFHWALTNTRQTTEKLSKLSILFSLSRTYQQADKTQRRCFQSSFHWARFHKIYPNEGKHYLSILFSLSSLPHHDNHLRFQCLSILFSLSGVWKFCDAENN